MTEYPPRYPSDRSRHGDVIYSYEFLNSFFHAKRDVDVENWRLRKDLSILRARLAVKWSLRVIYVLVAIAWAVAWPLIGLSL